MKKNFRRTSKIGALYLVVVLFVYNIPSYTQQSTQTKQDNISQFLYGIASVYDSDFDGETVASGNIYSPTALTVAHRSLPFNTRIEIENLSNGKRVEAIINDRGPFTQNRILNVSKQVADILGFLNEGTSFVKVTILELGTSLPTPMGLPTPLIGKDIPQGFTPTNINADLDQDLQTVDENNDLNEDDTVNNDFNENISKNVMDEDAEIIDFEKGIGEGNLNESFGMDGLNGDQLASFDTTAVTDDVLFEEDTLFEDDLFADFDNEFEFMDDSFDPDPSVDQELVKGKSQARAQNITNSSQDFVNNAPMEPVGFNTNNQDFLIDDPLSNIIIGPDEEYFAAPLPPAEVLNTAPYDITPEERQMLKRESSNTNPFSDLFDDRTDSYSLPQELRNSGVSPTKSIDPAYNIDGVGGVATENPINNIDSYNDRGDTAIEEFPIISEPIDVNTYTEGFDKQPSVNDVAVTNTEPFTPTPIISQPQTNIYPIPPTMDPYQEPAMEKPFTPQRIGDHYIIQLGAFSKQKNALDLYEKLRKSGFNAYITDVKINGRNLIRVRVGYFNTIEQAIQISENLQSAYNLENRIIQVEYNKPNN